MRDADQAEKNVFVRRWGILSADHNGERERERERGAPSESVYTTIFKNVGAGSPSSDHKHLR